ncbi:type III-B CRISPR module RAMP protein Cmr4 [Kallotenue papyrolyticum]|uniref:type III-B CRISPR module RAMP protein Cmr4 n=1 Tax=Kallotenue papyrolyticum TaxID=1325125 RepID=UPI000492A0B0|nr:type III-B CRISPR module RAMP protein Cmr4 [Kallotenue papyrolyticum]
MNTPYLYFIHALSPLHAGTGQGSGVIDLPIAREKATGIPYLPGSSVKGVLRDRSNGNQLTTALFGPPTENASEHAGSLQVADARLLLLPVRALRGTFAWVTSPYALSRFARDAAEAGFQGMPAVPSLKDEQCDVTKDTALQVTWNRQGQAVTRVVLEDLDLQPRSAQAAGWAEWLSTRIFSPDDREWPAMLAPRLCIVSDDVFSFLLTTAIEVIARNRLNENKTVAKGALWYEEALPAESVLYGLMALTPPDRLRGKQAELESHLHSLAQGVMQFGGKATVGRGLCRVRLLHGRNVHANA